MRRPLLPALLLSTLLLGCRVLPDRQPAPAPAPAPAPPQPAPAAHTPSAVFQSFLQASKAGDHAQAWDMLSKGAQAELGPSSEEFASRAFAGIKVRFGQLEETRAALDEVVNPTLAVVAVSGRRTPQEMDAAAAALVREEGVWKLALHGTVPIEPETLGPTDVVLRAPQITLERAWLDGQPVRPIRQGERYTVSIPADMAPRPSTVALLFRLQTGEPLGVAYPIGQ